MYLSTRQAAAEVGCHQQTIADALRRGHLRGFQRVPGKSDWRVKMEDLVKWVEAA